MASSSEQASGTRAYRAGVGVALVTSFLTVWTTIVRNDGTGMNFFLLIMAAAVGAFAAWFRAAGMARTMLGVAIMQLLLAIAIATAPSNAAVPDITSRTLLWCGTATILWLTSAAFFRTAAKQDT
jgi:hypothetical protein